MQSEPDQQIRVVLPTPKFHFHFRLYWLCGIKTEDLFDNMGYGKRSRDNNVSWPAVFKRRASEAKEAIFLRKVRVNGVVVKSGTDRKTYFAYFFCQ